MNYSIYIPNNEDKKYIFKYLHKLKYKWRNGQSALDFDYLLQHKKVNINNYQNYQTFMILTAEKRILWSNTHTQNSYHFKPISIVDLFTNNVKL